MAKVHGPDESAFAMEQTSGVLRIEKGLENVSHV